MAKQEIEYSAKERMGRKRNLLNAKQKIEDFIKKRIGRLGSSLNGETANRGFC